MGKQFGAGVTVKPMLNKEQFEKVHKELIKLYGQHDVVCTSVGHKQMNIQVKAEDSSEKLFVVMKDILNKLKFDVVERKEGNKKFLFIK